MLRVIWRVEIDTVPAGGKSYVDHDTRWARFLGKVERLVSTRVHVLQTCVRKLTELFGLGFGTVCWVAYVAGVSDSSSGGRLVQEVGHTNDHSKTLLESRHCPLCSTVPIDGNIIDGRTTV
jgi:hypothetical protein